MFTFDVCWGSLGSNIFENPSPAVSNTRSRLPSRLSCRFLWLWTDGHKNKEKILKKPTLSAVNAGPPDTEYLYYPPNVDSYQFI